MKGRLKNITVLILLLAIMAPISFAFLSYRVQLKLIKREVKHQLINETDRNDLVAFTFDLNSAAFKSLRWKHKHEFELDGKMFDILEADTIADTVHFLCFPDKQETALNLIFKKKLEDRYANDVPSKNRVNQMRDFFSGLYLISEDKTNRFPSNLSIEACKDYEALFQSITLDITVPPPKFSA